MAIRRVTRAGVGLVVGIIILAALVFAGLWFVRERGEQARRDEAINIAEEQLQSDSDEDIAIKPDENSNSEEAENQGSSPAPQTGATTNQPANANELPQTGPEAASAIVLGLLTFATVAFIRSRKLGSSQL
ncbi:MAG: hypothetical protein V4611_02675 [Patescibacteria group bacterium]